MSRSASDFYEYVIDGMPLRVQLRTADVGVIAGFQAPNDYNRYLARHLLPGLEEALDPRLDDRAILYGCRECLDIECGGIAASISQIGDGIRWDKFVSFGRLYDADDNWILEPIDIGPFEFDLEEYRSILSPFV
jgi:hypothetical protein